MGEIRVMRAGRLQEIEPGEGCIETALGQLLHRCHEEARASPDAYKPITMRSVEYLVDYDNDGDGTECTLVVEYRPREWPGPAHP